jgi:hypothetical protein
MAILAYQAFIVFSLFTIRIVARRHLATACFVWSGFTVLNLFFWPLILVQLAVVWVTYAVLKPKDDTPRVSDGQLGPQTSSPLTPATTQPLATKPEVQFAAKQAAGKRAIHKTEAIDTSQTILGAVNKSITDFNSFAKRAIAAQEATSRLEIDIHRETVEIEINLAAARKQLELEAKFAKDPSFQKNYEKFYALLTSESDKEAPENVSKEALSDYAVPDFRLPTRHANADIANAIEQRYRKLQQQREAFLANLRHILDRDTALRTHFFKTIKSSKTSTNSEILEAELHARLQPLTPTAAKAARFGCL